MNQFGIKEIERVYLKATYPIEIGKRKIESGEVIAAFDKISLANLQEQRTWTSANGGYHNVPHVFWETSKNVDLVFTQGVFNEDQFSLMYNAKLIESTDPVVSVTYQEKLESNDLGLIFLTYQPNNKVYIYDVDNGLKILTSENSQEINIGIPDKEVLVSYEFNHASDSNIVKIGDSLINGFLSLEGTVRVKDDDSGAIRTGIIKIPRLKLMSSLSMRLGAKASPLMGTVNATGYPVGPRGSEYLMEIIFLDSNIYSDL